MKSVKIILKWNEYCLLNCFSEETKNILHLTKVWNSLADLCVHCFVSNKHEGVI